MHQAKKPTYNWISKQIQHLNNAVINHCSFCSSNTKNKYAFPTKENLKKLTTTSNFILNKDYDKSQINSIKLLEEYINHYEFIIMEERLIDKDNGLEYKKWDVLLTKLESLRKIMDKLITNVQYNLNINNNSAIDTLSKVSFIFLPLSFITGYFGMNFTTMGVEGFNVNKNGILMWKNGHTIIKVILFLVLCISIIILFTIEYSHKSQLKLANSLATLIEIEGGISDV